MISYNPLWKQLIEKNMTKTELRKKINMSPSTLAKMGKNDYIAMSLLDKICEKLDCKIEDIVEYQKKEK